MAGSQEGEERRRPAAVELAGMELALEPPLVLSLSLPLLSLVAHERNLLLLSLSPGLSLSLFVSCALPLCLSSLPAKISRRFSFPLPLFPSQNRGFHAYLDMYGAIRTPRRCLSDTTPVRGTPYGSKASCPSERRPWTQWRSQELNIEGPAQHGSHVKVIAATSSAATLVVILLMVATALYLSLKTRYDEEIHLKVEMFLKTYGMSKPTRYTFSEVKKVARRFKEKVGQGGFGSVYKGELPNGVPVAVKMLENSMGEGEEFINEVATIGLIHHANIVRLLGFCSEGTRRALIYEFMPNDSLEKYIFLSDSNASQELLVPSKMVDVALGIAQGMEYLHQGCNKRILHFDIKPHNILLDYNFNPKISDFGLAKLCARDQSIVTLTAARGTMGYIAPELYSPNFGGVSYKSDVYSFGMLVLEMVSGRRNSDPNVDSQNEVYLPEWVFEKVITGQEQDLVLAREMTGEEKGKVRQLAIVALWCIQWNPRNRPSMTRVVNMLTGRLENPQIPPKPFVSSESHLMS